MDRSFIYRIENSRKKELLDLSPLEEKDGGLFCSYTRNVTAQIAQAQTEQEMRAVCLAINEYIEKKGIDICYVVNENVLNDLLHNHEQLYQRLLSAEEQNKRVLEKLDIITRSNQELETKCAEQDKELIRLHKNWCNSKIQQQRLYDKLKQQFIEKEKENQQLKKKLHTAEQETLHFQNKYFAEKQIAIEQLEKVKETMSNSDESGYLIRFSTMNDREKFNRVIDQQIKELRE